MLIDTAVAETVSEVIPVLQVIPVPQAVQVPPDARVLEVIPAPGSINHTDQTPTPLPACRQACTSQKHKKMRRIQFTPQQ
jgi:hypothetical protein